MARNSESETQSEHEGWSTKTRVILGLVGIGIFIVAYLIAWRLLPTSWTNFITGMTSGSVTTSWLLGIVIGFVFSLLPILIYLMGLRLRKSWKGIIGWFVVAVAIALPNIITIGVSTGDSRAEQSAANEMLTKAPGFITASYVGMAIGIAVGLWVAWVTYSRRRAKHKAEELKVQQEQKELAAQQAREAASTAHEAGDDVGGDVASSANDAAGSANDAASSAGEGFDTSGYADAARDAASDAGGAAEDVGTDIGNHLDGDQSGS